MSREDPRNEKGRMQTRTGGLASLVGLPTLKLSVIIVGGATSHGELYGCYKVRSEKGVNDRRMEVRR